jgi:hypothetical protein
MPGLQNPADEFIQAFHAGRAAKDKEELLARDAEDRKLQQQILKHQIDRLKIQDAITARAAAQENAALMEGRPARRNPNVTPMAPTVAEPTLEAGLQTRGFPGAAGPSAQGPTVAAPPGLEGQLMRRNLGGLVPTVPQTSVNIPDAREYLPNEPVNVPGIPGLGVPGVSITPRTQEEVQAVGLQDALLKLRMQRAENQVTINTPGGPVTVPKEAVSSVISGEYAGSRAEMTAQAAAQKAELDRAADAAKTQAQIESAQGIAKVRAGATLGAAGIRQEGAADRADAAEQAAEFRFWQQTTTAANKRLEMENRKLAEFDKPLKSYPSGTEIAQLLESTEGPGVRRWGNGAKMPLWLAKQYLTQAGDVIEARRMAQTDGWNTWLTVRE